MQHFRAFLWLTKEAAENEEGTRRERGGQPEMRRKLDTMLQAIYWTTEGRGRERGVSGAGAAASAEKRRCT